MRLATEIEDDADQDKANEEASLSDGSDLPCDDLPSSSESESHADSLV